MIVNYGTGNIQSVHNALEHLGHQVTRSDQAQDIENCDCLIFPGQGAFGPAISKLSSLNLIEPLQKYIQSKRPFIGICLGFQLLFNSSSEASENKGLSAFTGHFNEFNNDKLAVPHMGWNKIYSHGKSCLSGFNNEQFYFVHSYYLPTTTELNYATTDYDVSFISAIANETHLITQFHPEKSGSVGLALLEKFLKDVHE